MVFTLRQFSYTIKVPFVSISLHEAFAINKLILQEEPGDGLAPFQKNGERLPNERNGSSNRNNSENQPVNQYLPLE